MLFAILMISSVVLFTVAPFISLAKYYSVHNFGIKKNVFWIIVSLISWPLVPFILAWRNKDVLVVSIFSVSFGIWFMSIIYLLTLVLSVIPKVLV